MKRPVIAGTGALLIALVVAVIGLAASSDGASSENMSSVQSTKDLASSYAILRASAPHRERAAALEGVASTVAGVNPSAAHRVSRGDTDYWVTVGTQDICLAVRAAGASYSTAACGRAVGAATEGFFVTSRPAPDSANARETTITGLIPDGVRTVTITTSDGTTADLPVDGNIVSGTFANAPATARFVTSDGQAASTRLGSGK